MFKAAMIRSWEARAVSRYAMSSRAALCLSQTQNPLLRRDLDRQAIAEIIDPYLT